MRKQYTKPTVECAQILVQPMLTAFSVGNQDENDFIGAKRNGMVSDGMGEEHPKDLNLWEDGVSNMDLWDDGNN